MPNRNQRDNNFNLMRLLLATAVLLGHAYEMRYDGRSREPLAVLTHTTMSLGVAAVDMFFVISGFLILQSWLRQPKFGLYLRKRLLRIVPGYAVAALLSTFVVGLAATHSWNFFRGLTWRWPFSLLLLDSPITPPVFPGHHWDFVDGALWSIKYEFRCYLLVAAAGMLGLFRRAWPWIVFTVAAFAVGYTPLVREHMMWQHALLVLGDPKAIYELLPAFLAGGCFYMLWPRLPRSRWAIACALGLLLALCTQQALVEPAIILLGGYLLLCFAFARVPALERFKHAPDLSYGLYLYAWPVEALWTWYLHTAAWICFLGSLAICLPLAWLSWHVIERPSLLRKPKGSVPVPDAG